ncbi:lipid IV(A) 3-deoxy-D-manno-octulosonic acid transferase [Oceanobacter sp. 5_MG-2023]|uniref:lipid IV(A) 3-deoxy-D-manno-octulosonic acid transferase n=1 Tax=Oceanobacter sp. 5_MG-2023 TaxID=3062645 RepID=UPI0026E1973F|nr:lipid IV(A) 3-deoxy-D-manno-octulosonic acid transferase [Oceanobacter sp. 5_MG-2023]MDO6680762.1 lipid IV(A) 3-deoxy-D-manno-octulosonic acid transferase [Oceanobacter sp. 5_MG-2023]
MARLGYTVFLTLITPILLARLWWRGRKNPGYRQRIVERFGAVTPLPHRGAIWVHAVSVGETLAAAPLIEQLLRQYPQRTIWITSTTPTGAAQVERLFGDRVRRSFMPYDLPLCWWLFLRRTKPDCLVVMETELWPNLLACCQQRGVPVLLANARLSERSARGYARLSALTRPMLQRLTHVAVQHQVDGQRLLDLGLPPSRLSVCGSIKYDVVVPAGLDEQAAALKQGWGKQRPVVLLASSHDGEESLMLAAMTSWLRRWPELLLVLVPRHPERFGPVAQACLEQGFTLAQRSTQAPGNDAQVYLADSMGEMLLLLAAADVVVMGGSLVPRGGHNPIEPAVLGKPVLMGPHYFNFQTVVDELVDIGAVQLTTAVTLAGDVALLLDHPEQRQQMGLAGYNQVQQNQGAVARLVANVATLLSDNAH